MLDCYLSNLHFRCKKEELMGGTLELLPLYPPSEIWSIFEFTDTDIINRNSLITVTEK